VIVRRWRDGRSLLPTREDSRKAGWVALTVVVAIAGFLGLFWLAARIMLR
jgi:hypothetical protein